MPMADAVPPGRAISASREHLEDADSRPKALGLRLCGGRYHPYRAMRAAVSLHARADASRTP